MAETLNIKVVPSLEEFFYCEDFISMVCGPVGCLAGSTLVLTEFGPIPIADIDRPMRVLSWNKKTCRFQLSWCGGAFPKGRDYLYQVVTPQGEFGASGKHLLLCADGEYRPVEELQVGCALASYSDTPQQTTEELCQLVSHEDARRLSRIPVDYLGDCAALDRLRGQPFLWGEGSAPGTAQQHTDAPSLLSTLALDAASQFCAQEGGLSAHTHSGIYDGPPQTGGYAAHSGCPRGDGEGHGQSLFGEHTGGTDQLELLFPLTNERRQPGRTLQGHLGSFRLTPTERPIILLTRKQVSEPFWDMQVEDTHNYVTVDGAVHHNSAKTTAGIQKILYHAARMAPCKDGVRRSRAIWVRQTREQLRDTSIPDFLKWFPDGKYGVFLKSEYKYVLRVGNIECEVLFRGLDDSNDVRRLLSMQASFAIFEEFRELNPDIFNAMQARLGRYPDGMMVPHKPEWGYDKRGHPIQGCVTEDGQSNRRVWGMSNPPDGDTFWEQFLTNPPSNASVVIQPSGMSPEADWVHLLPSNYYEDLAEGKSQEYIDVYIHARFGQSLSGRPVFRCFNKDLHIAKTTLLVQPSTLVIGVDAGLNPTAVLTQAAYDGRILVPDAITGSEGGMGAVRFIRERLKPLLAKKYLGRDAVIIIDPAAFQRSQTDERSVADVFRAEGFLVKPARTNSIAARIAAGENAMTRLVEGKPVLVIDPACTELVLALRSKYRYRMNTKGEMDDTPEKLHPWSDFCFAAGTPVSTPSGLRAIETIQPGDFVTTPNGMQRVLAAGKVSDSAEVWEWRFSDGAQFVATPDHPVYVESAGGFVSLADVEYTDILVSIFNRQRMLKWEPGITGLKRQEIAHGVEKPTIALLRLKSLGIAHLHARLLHAGIVESITNDERVQYVARGLLAASMSSGGHVVRLVGKRRLPRPTEIYMLQVEHEPMYFASGVLVKNCDAFTYALLQHDNGVTFGSKLMAQRRVIKPAPHQWAVT